MYFEGGSPNACYFAALGKFERGLLELVNMFFERECYGCFDVTNSFGGELAFHRNFD